MKRHSIQAANEQQRVRVRARLWWIAWMTLAHGEVGAAVVVLREGVVEDSADGGGERGAAAPGPVSESELGAWMRERMAPYKAPRTFRFVDRIPRNAMGKVNKKDLRAQYLRDA